MRFRLFLSSIAFFLACSTFAQTAPPREVAFTIDDLPATGANAMSGAEILELTTKLLSTLHQQNVPAVGFVNERKLYRTGEVDDRIKALNLWLDSGQELGNHAYSHMSLNNSTLHDWEEDVVRGETVTRLLLAKHGAKLRYFRHPYLDVGRDLQTRREAEAFLISRGYHIAPVTLDGWDWMYARVYEDARKRGDAALQQQLVTSYLAHTGDVLDYEEKLSRTLFGYEVKHVLLLHGNWLEADHIGELIDLFRKRGYKFITLQEALSDSAYSVPNDFIGEEGSCWLEQFAITRGQIPMGGPEFPQWVIELSKKLPPESAQQGY